jgi:hypothetical protein
MARRARETRDTFTYDEVGEMIKSATRLQQLADENRVGNTVTLGQLQEVAAELNIPPDSLQRAVAAARRDGRAARKRVRRKLRWFRHAGTYAAITAGIVGADLAAGGGLEWPSFFSMIGWGSVVGVHGAFAFSSRGSRLEQRLIDREMSRD